MPLEALSYSIVKLLYHCEQFIRKRGANMHTVYKCFKWVNSGGSHKARRQELEPFGPNAHLSMYNHPRNPDDGFYTLDGFIAMLTGKPMRLGTARIV